MKLKLCPDRPWPEWFSFLNGTLFFATPFVGLSLSDHWGNWVLIPMMIIILWTVTNAVSI